MRSIQATKLYLPETPSNYIPRQALLSRLDEGLNQKLTLVSAPAGFGKTSLIASWLHSQRPTATSPAAAWYTIDSFDNNPNVFVNHLAAAIRGAVPDILPDWVSPDRRPVKQPIEEIAGELIEPFLNYPGRLILVLDDYHHITQPDIHRLVAYMLRYLPSALHLVIISRFDPPVGLSQLFARNHVNEFRSQDLLLNLSESSRFFDLMLDSPPSPEQVEVLWQRTEGWAVGLQLAAISMRSETDHTRFVERFTHHIDRHVASYLFDEVLERQPGDTRRFLLSTSILSRFNSELCAHLLGSGPATSREVIDLITEENLFILPLDNHDEWYRYHSQFRTMLNTRLQLQMTPAEVQALHARAAHWLVDQQLINEALPHFISAGDLSGAADVVERHLPKILNQDMPDKLSRMLAILPAEIIEQRPALLLGQAWVHYNNLTLTLIPPLVERAAALLADPDTPVVDRGAAQGQLIILTAVPRVMDHTNETLITQAKEALSLLSPQYGWARALTLSYLSQLYQGRGEEVQYLPILHDEIAAVTNQAGPYIVHLYLMLTSYYFGMGNISNTRESADKLVEYSRHYDMPAMLITAQFLQAASWLENDEVDNAVAQFETIISQHQLAPMQILLLTANSLLPIYAERKQGEQGEYLLAIIRARLRKSHDAHSRAEFDALEGYWALLRGDLAAAARWVDFADRAPTILFAAFRSRRLAETMIKLGRPEDVEPANDLMKDVLALYDSYGDARGRIQLRLLLAMAAWQTEQTDAALSMYGQALDLGFPLGYRRTFIELGSWMVDMLRRLTRVPQHTEAARLLLHQFTVVPDSLPRIRNAGQESEFGKIEPLTYRELEVLKLIGLNLSNKEIGSRLFISSYTVRNHTSNIYTKLNVNNRGEARRVGRLLGIID